MTIVSLLRWDWLRSRGKRNANQIAALFGYAEPPVDVLRIAKEMGISTHYLPNTREYADTYSLVVMRKGSPEIHLNENLSIPDQRFALAHAIGHLLLHPLPKGPVLFHDHRKTPKSVMEREADRFASELLMPRQIIGATAHLGNLSQLAHAFNVSPSQMSDRLEGMYGRIQKFERCSPNL